MKITDFKTEEFDCKCGCGKNNINSIFLQKLQRARTYAGIPFIINSGCRCYTHNKNVGGVATSEHLSGEASDIRSRNSVERFKIVDAAICAGFRRIGIGKEFVHVGDGKDKPQEVLWLY